MGNHRNCGAKISFYDFWMMRDFGGSSFRKLAAMMKHGDTLTTIENDVHVMLYQDNRQAALPYTGNQTDQASCLAAGKTGSRLVKQ